MRGRACQRRTGRRRTSAEPHLLDLTTEFGARADRRLREELIGWLVTVNPAGAPVPVPVWFLWDGSGSLLIYSRPGTAKLRNIAAGPRVCVHLDGDGAGGDVVVVSGRARISDDPGADGVDAYIAKYAERVSRNGWTPASFAADYSVPIRVEVTRISGH
ncbi:MAG TPA: TIGR03667 family PPOX class F420-dependent oxidoreductase [Gaiellales bacterium]|nr:TIGR03667 family PPOX class F420-dependent oxidoreductase [Gaiellales bacterium]